MHNSQSINSHYVDPNYPPLSHTHCLSLSLSLCTNTSLSIQDDDDESDDDNEYLSEDEEEDDENNLQKLVDSLNPELRNKIRNKQSADDDEEDDDEDDDEEEGWGKKKNYWNGDTADLEIGQEFEDAVDEEEAAKELHQQKLKRMNKKDFRDDFDDDDDEEESSDDDDIETLKKISVKKSQTKDKVARELEAITLKEDGDLNLVSEFFLSLSLSLCCDNDKEGISSNGNDKNIPGMSDVMSAQ